uniref:Uncharacterized protein n=1 Tax=Ciona intestinalis TaxID=7719 RepID=H2XQS1_CIOIN
MEDTWVITFLWFKFNFKHFVYDWNQRGLVSIGNSDVALAHEINHHVNMRHFRE